MPQPSTDKLSLPITPYTVGGYRFGQRIRRRMILWATHLGDDIVAVAGTPVHAIGDGQVVFAEIRSGSASHRNWGGLIVIAHRNQRNNQATNHKSQDFYSLYGHIADLQVKQGDTIARGQKIGSIAAGSTPENGYWKTPHLHFAIYVGPWRGNVLPGYIRPEDWLRKPKERRTQRAWWRDPRAFIAQYNSSL